MDSKVQFFRHRLDLWLCVVAVVMGTGGVFAYKRQVQARARAQMAAKDPRVRRFKEEQQDQARRQFLQSHVHDVQRPEPFAWHTSLTSSSALNKTPLSAKLKNQELKENK